MSRRFNIVTLAVAVLVTACGGSAAPSPAKPPAAVTTSVLASGHVDALPTGALFVNYLELPQAAGGSIKHKHGAGFVYATKGSIALSLDGASPLMLQPGQAAFTGANVMHEHLNPASGGNDWWFVGLRAAASRPLPTIVTGQKELYTTADLTQISPGAYTESLVDDRLPAKGVDREPGSALRVVYVLDGTVTVSGDAAMAGTVPAGQGAYALPGSVLVLTAGSADAHYLVFTLTQAT